MHRGKSPPPGYPVGREGGGGKKEKKKKTPEITPAVLSPQKSREIFKRILSVFISPLPRARIDRTLRTTARKQHLISSNGEQSSINARSIDR
jgi:hypothetical protein